MPVQVKFKRGSESNPINTAEALEQSKTSGNTGTIYFTTDKHQIVINGAVYGGQEHKVIENDHDIYAAVPSQDEGGADNADFQAYLAKLYRLDTETGKNDAVNRDDYYVYKRKIVENFNHAKYAEVLAAQAAYDAAPTQSLLDALNAKKAVWQSTLNTDESAWRISRTAYVCTSAPVITYNSTTQKYSCTDFGTWAALDGNYDADNVYLSCDITMAGNYDRVGNLEKSLRGVGTFSCKGMSVREALEAILMKVEWPNASDITYVGPAEGPAEKTISYNSLPALNVWVGTSSTASSSDTKYTGSANGTTKVVEVGSYLFIGGGNATNANHGTPANRTFSYSTLPIPGASDNTESYTVENSDSIGIYLNSGTNLASWGITTSAIPSIIEGTADGTVLKPTSNSPEYGGWKGDNKSLTLTYSRTPGAGSLRMWRSDGGVGTLVFDAVEKDGSNVLADNKRIWKASHTTSSAHAGKTYSCNGGTVANLPFGSITINLKAEQADTFSRLASGGSAKQTNDNDAIEANSVGPFYTINNIGTTDQVAIGSATHKIAKKNAQKVYDHYSDVVISGTQNPTSSITIHAVYPFKHNGANATFTGGKTADQMNTDTTHTDTGTDLNFLKADGTESAWTQNPDTKGEGLCDVHASGSRYYYVSWPAQEGKPRQIALPLKSSGSGGDTYCSYEAMYRNPDANKWAGTATFTYISTSGGYKIYEWGGNGGAQIVRIKIS